jgi:hypothetical protein
MAIDGLDEARGEAFSVAEDLLVRLGEHATVIVSTRGLPQDATLHTNHLGDIWSGPVWPSTGLPTKASPITSTQPFVLASSAPARCRPGPRSRQNGGDWGLGALGRIERRRRGERLGVGQRWWLRVVEVSTGGGPGGAAVGVLGD